MTSSSLKSKMPSAPVNITVESQLSEPLLPTNISIDSGWAWVITAACFVIQVMTFGSFRIFGLINAELVLHCPHVDCNKVFAVQSVGFALAIGLGPLGLVLNKRWSCRVAQMIGGVLTSLGYILSYFVIYKSPIWLFFTYGILVGGGCGICLSNCYIIITQYFSRYIAFATSLMMLGNSVGSLAWPYLFRFFIDEYGLEGTLAIFGAITLNCLPAAGLLRSQRSYSLDSECGEVTYRNYSKEYGSLTKSRPRHILHMHDYISIDGNATKSERPTMGQRLCYLMTLKYRTIIHTTKEIINFKFSDKIVQCIYVREPRVFFYALSFGLIDCAMVPLFTIIPIYAEEMGISDEIISQLMSVIGAADTVSRVIIGALGDLPWLRSRRVMLYGLTCILFGGSSVVTSFFPNLTTFRIYVVFVGAFGPTIWTIFSVLLVDAFGKERFHDVYPYATAFLLPSPILSGFFSEYTKSLSCSWKWPVRICGIEALLAFFVLFTEIIKTVFFPSPR